MTSQTVEQSIEDQTPKPSGPPPEVSGASPGRLTYTAAPSGAGYDGGFVWLERFPNPLRQPLGAVAWIVRVLIGVVTLLALLTIIAAVPVLNLIALGYLLEAEGQVARTGKLRHALPLLPAALRIGSIVAGTLLWLVPVMLLADVVADARLIAPHGTVTRLWTAALALVSTVSGIQIVLAWSGGGSLGCFVRPIDNVRRLREKSRSDHDGSRADRGWRDFLAALRPLHLFWLGARGFLGTWAWLALPTALYGAWWHSGSTWLRLPTVVAGAWLVPVLAWVPFLQVRLAAEDRWSAMCEVRQVRALFRHAPLAWLTATVALYLLSIPLFLYSLRYRMHAPFALGIWWDLTFVSIMGTIPARAALGWAYHRAQGRGPAWIGWIWLSRLLLAVALALYVWLLFQTPLTHEAHPWQLEHHALVLPVPW